MNCEIISLLFVYAAAYLNSTVSILEYRVKVFFRSSNPCGKLLEEQEGFEPSDPMKGLRFSGPLQYHSAIAPETVPPALSFQGDHRLSPSRRPILLASDRRVRG